MPAQLARFRVDTRRSFCYAAPHIRKGYNMKTTLILLATFTCLLTSAAPAYFAGTDSYYDVVRIDGTWTAARLAAESTSYLGRPGRLATITSLAENDFVAALLPEYLNIGYAIGGMQPPDAPNDQGWSWISGEAWSFTNWAPGEPNNFGGIENYLVMYSNFGPDKLGTWNDVSDSDAFNHGYVIEFAAIPEPGAAVLGLLAVALFGLRRTSPA